VAATFGRAMYRLQLPNLTIGTNTPQSIDNVQIAPNPFTENSRISFNLPAKQTLQLELYDLSGKRIKTIFAGELSGGTQAFELDGNGLSHGVYLLKIYGKGQTGFCKKVVKQ
jgi:hypothetical protein